MNGHLKHFALIAQLARKYKMSKKEYDHTDHMAIMTELLVLYQLKNETQEKINVAQVKNEKMKELLKEKEKEDIPF
jgi:hypothetical protein